MINLLLTLKRKKGLKLIKKVKDNPVQKLTDD